MKNEFQSIENKIILITYIFFGLSFRSPSYGVSLNRISKHVHGVSHEGGVPT